MRQSQAEIKAIEAELRSIRADSKVTLLDPHHRAQQPNHGPIAPTIDRQALMASQEQPQRHVGQSTPPIIPQPNSSRPVNPSSKKRAVECFPLPKQHLSDYDQPSNYGRGQATETRTDSRPRHRTARQLAFAAEQFDSSQSPQYRARLLLAEKASQINALSNQQEAVILELMSLSETLSEQLDHDLQPICEYRTAEVPYVETAKTGTLRLKSRAVDLSYLDPGEETHLPHRLRRPRGLVGLLGAASLFVWQTTWGLLKTVGAVARLVAAPFTGFAKLLLSWSASTAISPAAATPTATATATAAATVAPRRRSHRRPVETPFTLREAAILVIGSALLRIGLDWLVVLYPMLWIPSILVMLTPAAIAVYRSTLSPQTGFAWGYRLFSIMIGLLLGGRL